MTFQGFAHGEGLGGELKDTRTRLGMLSRGKRLADHDADRTGEVLGQFPKRFPSTEAEDRTPHAVDRNGNDGGATSTSDQLETFAQLHQAAITRQAAFRKDADDLATREGFARLDDGLFGLRLGNRNRSHQAAHEADELMPFETFPREEAHRTTRHHTHHQHVGIGDMVRDKKYATFCRDVLQPADTDGIPALQEQPAKGVHDAIPQRHRLMPARGPPGEGQQENCKQEQAERDERQGDHQQEPAEGVKQGHPAQGATSGVRCKPSPFEIDPSPPLIAL